MPSPVRRFSAYLADEAEPWAAENRRYREQLAATRADFPTELFALHDVQSFHDGCIRHAQTVFLSGRHDVVLIVFTPRNGPLPTNGDPMFYTLHYQSVQSGGSLEFPEAQQEIAYTDIRRAAPHCEMIFQFVDGRAWSIVFTGFRFLAYDCARAHNDI
jgi:hypothetical protein